MNGASRYLATNLGATLDHQGRTGRWLANRLGVSESLISKVLKGERTIDGGFAEKIAFVIDVPLFLLFELHERSDLQSPTEAIPA
jgi:transcriptional regulator with XRE-family HTH domain